MRQTFLVYSSLSLQKTFQYTSNLVGFEMLFFLPPNRCIMNTSVNSVSAHCCNCKCIDCWNFEDRIATQRAHCSYGTLENTQPNHSVYTVCGRQVDTKDKTEEGRCWPRQCRGCKSWPPGAGGCGPSYEAHLLICTPTNGGRKHTQSRQYCTLLTLTHLLIQSAALILCRWQCQ